MDDNREKREVNVFTFIALNDDESNTCIEEKDVTPEIQ